MRRSAVAGLAVVLLAAFAVAFSAGGGARASARPAAHPVGARSFARSHGATAPNVMATPSGTTCFVTDGSCSLTPCTELIASTPPAVAVTPTGLASPTPRPSTTCTTPHGGVRATGGSQVVTSPVTAAARLLAAEQTSAALTTATARLRHELTSRPAFGGP